MIKYFLIFLSIILFLTATNVYADQVYINKDVTLDRNLNVEADDKFV